ncbi:MAG: hypothetical protein ACYC69_06470 [Thermodesulfovibrionales bacterium]
MNKEIEKALQNYAGDGKITCAIARKIAEDLKVPYKEVGETANRLGIRIKDCQLGCF